MVRKPQARFTPAPEVGPGEWAPMPEGSSHDFVLVPVNPGTCPAHDDTNGVGQPDVQAGDL